MAGSVNPQDTIDSIITVLQNNLTAKFAALNATYNDGITIPAVADYWRAPLERLDNFPACVIVCSRTEYPGEVRRYAIQYHTIHLQYILVSIETSGALLPQELLNTLLGRSMRGLQEVLEANRQLTLSGSDNANYLWLEDIAYTETAHDQGVFRRDGVMTIKVQISP